MLFQTIGQIPIFLWMIGTGVLMGALYAFFGAVRHLLQAGFWLSLVCDAVFGLLASAMLIISLILVNHAQIRAYMFLGLICGLTLFALGPYPLLRRFSKALRHAASAVYRKLSECRLMKVIFR